LTQAVDIALRNSPQLAGYPLEFQAAEGRVQQASLLPNPEFSVDVENVWGDLPGWSMAETTYSISQLLEVGKRSPRIRMAESERGVLQHESDIVRLNVVADVKRGFINALSARKKLELNREGHRFAELLASGVTGRVSAGAVSPIEETRARVVLAVSSANVERSALEFEAARRELAATMGESTPSFESLAGDLDEDFSLPPADNVAERIQANPDVTRWIAERDRRNAVLEAERSMAIPNVTLTGGIRHFRENSDTTFVLGFSVPLPLFNRNQGAIREAEALRSKADTERRATELLLQSQVGQRQGALMAARREATLLREEALLGAQSAYDAVSEGYRLGKFRYLDVLDAGKTLVETRLRYLEAVTAFHLAKVDLERLLATREKPYRNDQETRQGAAR
jgi:cobalt-zinc-cadmium efflux system outer membrane protein